MQKMPHAASNMAPSVHVYICVCIYLVTDSGRDSVAKAMYAYASSKAQTLNKKEVEKRKTQRLETAWYIGETHSEAGRWCVS